MSVSTWALVAWLATGQAVSVEGYASRATCENASKWMAGWQHKCIPGGISTIGPEGPMGPRGYAGKNGLDGAAGATGATGATGAMGPEGPKGDKGDKGDPGDCSTNPKCLSAG